MADKTQNITINYRFNTAEVDRANGVLNRANNITNNLQASGQRVGQTLGQGFRQATSSIAAMQVQLGRLKTQIEVSSDPSRVKLLSDQYRVLKKSLDDATTAAFKNAEATKKTAASTQNLASNFGGLYSAVKTLFAAGIAKELFDITLSAAELSGKVEGVERAFNRAFPNAVKLLDDLRAATNSTISDFELMQRTLQATNLGVGVEQLPQLFAFATARAQQTGEAVDYLVDSIVRGIGRKSALILDNLGISAIRLKQELNGVSLQAASVGEVTEAVGKIAQEELNKMGGYAVTAATKVGQLKTAAQDLQIVLAKKFGSGFIVDFAKEVVTGLKELVKGEKELLLEEAKRRAANQVDAFVKSKEFKEQKENQGAQIDLLLKEIIERQRLVRVRQQEIDLNLAKEKSLREDLTILDINSATEGILKQVEAQKQSKSTLEQSIPILAAYIQQLRGLATLEEDAEPSGIVTRKKKEIEDLQKLIEQTNNIGDLGALGTLTTKLEIAQAELGDLLRVFHDFKGVAFKFEIGEMTDRVNRFGQAIKSTLDPLSKFSQITKNIGQGQAAAQALDAFDLSRTNQQSPFNVPNPGQTVAETDSFFDLLKDEFVDNWQDITANIIDIQANGLKTATEIELNNLKSRLKNIQSFYGEQQLLAGDNQRYQQELRVKEERETAAIRNQIARKEKQARKTQVIIDTAAGIGKAFATAPNIYIGIFQAALVAAQMAIQLKAIDRTQTNFAKGVIDLNGPGTETSDSIPARLSRRESVMTAWETKNAGDVLRAVRARKLDNKTLRDLQNGRNPVISSQRFDDSNLLRAIAANKPPDVVEQSNIVYNVNKYSDEYRQKIRNKSVRI